MKAFGPLIQAVVEVAARNDEANQLLLWQANHDAYPEVTENLTNLYTFAWPDDGDAVAGYTDWIVDARASGDPERIALANEASADLISFVTAWDVRRLRR
ncbi:MAG TPA: hypothetical protein VEX15_15590 [Nocardioidaceae bacterium]|nr:hypothetical protein [Nocardioidaceae bacterium]